MTSELPETSIYIKSSITNYQLQITSSCLSLHLSLNTEITTKSQLNYYRITTVLPSFNHSTIQPFNHSTIQSRKGARLQVTFQL